MIGERIHVNEDIMIGGNTTRHLGNNRKGYE